ncbi:GMC oxidoreductase [Cnuibacter physcomitrellae]|uniref:GMC oxidoreductase n=1 Tax=Cnuibacter physcomitrellae TaxID=1619308 RepID=UPI00217592CA|nr:GMC oxidoreductase [Cnuibacter physcomitrellae]MCS5497987.1 GMC oxidoreductase [Cnuibacter physcomitrellae]
MSAERDVDVLIIGSGPAGSMYARTIGESLPQARILIVEVGPPVPGSRGNHTQNMTDAERAAVQLLTQGPEAGVEREVALLDIAEGLDPSLEFRQTILPGLHFVDSNPTLRDGEVGLPAASMSTGVGGMGIHWGTSTPRPHQSERIRFIPAEEMDAALAHAEEVLQVTTQTPPGTGLAAEIYAAMADEFDGPGLTPVGFMPSATHWEGDRLVFSGTGVILGDIEETVPGFELRSETLARRVLVEDGVAVGAELEDRTTGERYAVRAARVVVCADGLRTPQVLFASSIRPAALGHHLNEHFQMASFVLLNEDFDPSRFERDPKALGYVLVPFSDARPMQGGIMALAGSPYALGLGDDAMAQRLGVLAWYAAKDVRAEDAVEFSETETDFYGMPRMSIRYSRTERDLEVIEEMRRNSVRAAERIGTLTEEPTLAAGGSSLHYQGTVRMGAADDGTSVCDDLLRVWGVANLYVGGNGVIPTSTAANPTLTTVALAWRAAQDLAASLSAELADTASATAAAAVTPGAGA